MASPAASLAEAGPDPPSLLQASFLAIASDPSAALLNHISLGGPMLLFIGQPLISAYYVPAVFYSIPWGYNVTMASRCLSSVALSPVERADNEGLNQ